MNMLLFELVLMQLTHQLKHPKNKGYSSRNVFLAEMDKILTEMFHPFLYIREEMNKILSEILHPFLYIQEEMEKV